MSLKTGGISHVPLRIMTSQPLGSTRGMLSTKPPPVMWARALIVGHVSRLSLGVGPAARLGDRLGACAALNFLQQLLD